MNPESLTSGYAYFKRDTRRSFPPSVAVTARSLSSTLLPPPPPPLLDRNSKMEITFIAPVPGKRRIYKKSDEQPPATGYFPVINCE